MAENKAKTQIFISYGHDNFAKLVSDIEADLKKRGYETWVDYKTGNIDPADNYNIKIQDGLDKSNKMLLFLSVHSMRQDKQNEYGYCLNEIDYAKYKPMQIVSVMLEDVPPYLPIAAIRRIDLSDLIVNGEIVDDKYNEILDQICEYLEKNETLLGQEESDTILSRLNPFAYEGNPKSCKDYYERKWLTDSYLDWVHNKPDSKLLCIMGSAGSGKTEFISHLCKIKSFVSAVHFCRYNTNRTNSKRIIMSLAYYLATQIPEYEKKLEKAVDEEHKNLASSSFDYLFNLLFEEPLNAIKNPGQKIIIIDAVDEATTSTGENDLLNSIISRLDKLPDWLRLVITTRPEQNIEKAIKDIANFKYDIIDIDSNPENNENDLRGFIAQGLSKKLEKLQPSEQSNIINSLLEKVNGNFVYASYVVKDCLGQEGSLSEIIKNLPKGLNDYYKLHLKRIFETTYICDTCKQNIAIRPKLANQDCIVEDCEICGKKTIHKELKTNKIVHSYESCKPILELIAAQYEPLTWKQMFNILNTNDSISEDVFKSQIDQLTSLFVMRDGCLMAPHKSLLDWLNNGGLGADYKLNIENAHKKISEYLFKTNNEDVEKYKTLYLIDHCLKSHSLELIVDAINNVKMFNDRIELLGCDVAIKKYFVHLNELFTLKGELLENILNSELLLKIFSKYRDFICQLNLYPILQKIGFDKTVEKIDIGTAMPETIDSLTSYFYETDRISRANELIKLYVTKHASWETSAELSILNKYAILELAAGEFEKAEKICLQVMSSDPRVDNENTLLDKMVKSHGGSIINEKIRKCKIKVEVHCQIVNAIRILALIKGCKLDVKNSMLLFEKSERLFKVMSSRINNYKFESYQLIDFYRDKFNLSSASMSSLESFVFAFLGELINAKLYLNLWDMRQKYFANNELSNFDNIHWTAKMILSILENKFDLLFSMYSQILNLQHVNKYEIAVIEFIVAIAYYLSNKKDDASEHISLAKNNILNLKFYILEKLIELLEQKIDPNKSSKSECKMSNDISKLIEHFDAMLNKLKNR